MKATADDRLLVLFDADCGVCQDSARLLRRLDHGRHLRLVPAQAASAIVDAPSLDILLDALHVRDSRGRWSIGGSAWIRIADEVTILRPLAIVSRIPMIGWSIEWAYARVARNRHRISRLLGDDACPVPPKAP